MRFLLLFMLICIATVGFTADRTLKDPVRWGTLKVGANGKIKKETLRVIETEGEFASFWSELTGEPASRAPKTVNFSKDRVIAICAGERRTGGYEVMIRSVEFVNSVEFEVKWTEKFPTGVASQAITSPYRLLRVERNAGKVRFSRVTYQAHCDNRPPNDGTIIIIGGDYDQYPMPIRFGLLDRGSYSSVSRPTNFTLTSRREMLNYWSSAFPNRTLSEDDLESINWGEEIVVAIHLGTGSTNGKVAEIDKVVLDRDGKLKVTWFEETDRSLRDMSKQSPYVLIRIPLYGTRPVITKLRGRPIY
jgi:hypothetical protein